MITELKAKPYKGRFLEAGVSSNGGVAVLIRSENLMRLAEKFRGTYFSIDHEDLDESNIDLKKVGVASSIYKGEDGWAWFEAFFDKAEATKLLEQGYSISCAYTVTQKGAGGSHNGVDYDFEVLDIEADHIAIVPEPHYQDAIIIKNSNLTKVKNMFKFLTKSKKEEVIKNAAEEKTNAFVMNGEEKIAVKDLIENYCKVKAEEAEKAKAEEEVIMNADDEVEVGVEMKSLKDLMDLYGKKDKEESVENEAKEEKAEEEVKNEDKEEKEEEKKEEVKNEEDEEDFKKVKNAAKSFDESAEYKEKPAFDYDTHKKADSLINSIYSSKGK